MFFFKTESETGAAAAPLLVTSAVYYENESRWLTGERLHCSEISYHSSTLGPLIITAAIYFLRHFCCEAEYCKRERTEKKEERKGKRELIFAG